MPRYAHDCRPFLPRFGGHQAQGKTTPVEETHDQQANKPTGRRSASTAPGQADGAATIPISDFLYGSIGIQAVAAAARYSGTQDRP